MDDQERHSEKDDGNTDDTHPEGHTHIVDAEGHEYPHTPAAPDSKGQKVKKWFRSLFNAGPDRQIELGLTLAITFFAAAQWITSCTNNSSTATQVEKLIAAANSIQASANSFSTSSSNIDNGIKGAVGELGDQVQKMDDARQSSDTAAQNALKASIDNFHRDERAWVIFRGAGPAPAVGQIWHLIGVFTNSGKTPATDVQWNCVNEYAVNEQSLKWYRASFKKPTMLAPNDPGKWCSLTPTGDTKLTQPQLDELLNNAKLRLFFYGSAIYTDVFGHWHWLTFCQEMEIGGVAWDSCEKGNDTGDGKNLPPPFNGPIYSKDPFTIPMN